MTNRWLAALSFTALATLVGCDNNDDNTQNNSASVDNAAQPSTEPMSTDDSAASTTKTTTPRAIDWSQIDSGQAVIDPAAYDYPFAIDSQNVRDYADYFNIDRDTAQHNMTVSMASNEALSKVLNELGTSYVSHELTDGETIKLIIHTTPDIKADSYDYVFRDDFAEGLVLPIEIKPDGIKVDSKPSHDKAS